MLPWYLRSSERGNKNFVIDVEIETGPNANIAVSVYHECLNHLFMTESLYSRLI